MKNILSENMLRFGVKNLSESNKKRLTLESILKTIEEYGLSEQVRQALTEQKNISLKVNDLEGDKFVDKKGRRIFDTNPNLVYGLTLSADGQKTNFFIGKSSDPTQSYQTTLVDGNFHPTALDNFLDKIMKGTPIDVLPLEAREIIKQAGDLYKAKQQYNNAPLENALNAMLRIAKRRFI